MSAEPMSTCPICDQPDLISVLDAQIDSFRDENAELHRAIVGEIERAEKAETTVAKLTATIDQIHGFVDYSPDLSSAEVVMKIQELLAFKVSGGES